MTTLTDDVLRVELVHSLWENLLPVAAIVISLVSVCLTLWFRFSDRLKVNSKLSWLMPVAADGSAPIGQDRLLIRATNRSRTATTEIAQLQLGLQGNKTFARLEQTIYDADLPVTLEPGQSIEVTFDAYGLGVTLRELGPKGKWIRPIAQSGHRSFKGRKDAKTVRELIKYAQDNPRTEWGKG